MVSSNQRLAGKTALISGGAGGAGEAASIRFAQEGARVAIVDIQEEAGARLVSEIAAAGRQAIFAKADVSKAADVEAAVQKALKELGPIDILFNHAGTFVVKPFIDITEQDWDWLMGINLKSMFLMSRAVLPGMLEAGGGIIVNTGSVSGMTASALESLYCITKGAVHQLTRSIAVEYRDRGIRCNAIAPGFIKTPHGLREMKECVAAGVDFTEEAIAKLQGRMCEPEEIASVALFLASDDARFVNGSIVTVDNTWMAAS